jgi:hypothetical protein
MVTGVEIRVSSLLVWNILKLCWTRDHEEGKGNINSSHEKFGHFLRKYSMFDSYHKEEGRKHVDVFLADGCYGQIEKTTLLG